MLCYDIGLVRVYGCWDGFGEMAMRFLVWLLQWIIIIFGNESVAVVDCEKRTFAYHKNHGTVIRVR